MAHILKSYYGDIFFEFILNESESRGSVVLLPGFPSSASKKKVIRFLHGKGFNVFYPRYKGTFQSRGKFLEDNIVLEMDDFFQRLKKGRAKNLWNLENVNFETGDFILMASSFGANVACGVAAKIKSVSKLLLFSPLWDPRSHNNDYQEQDLKKVTKFVERAYGNLYRFSFENVVERMTEFDELLPDYYVERINSKNIPILAFHDPDDKKISIEHTKKMKDKMDDLNVVKYDGGHAFDTEILDNYWDKLNEFF